MSTKVATGTYHVTQGRRGTPKDRNGMTIPSIAGMRIAANEKLLASHAL